MVHIESPTIVCISIMFTSIIWVLPRSHKIGRVSYYRMTKHVPQKYNMFSNN